MFRHSRDIDTASIVLLCTGDRRLESITFNRITDIEPGAIAALGGLTDLKTLRLDFSFGCDRECCVTGELSTLRTLSSLCINTLKVGWDIASEIDGLPSLRILALGGSVAGAYLTNPVNIGNLHSLSLRGDAIVGRVAVTMIERGNRLARLDVTDNSLFNDEVLLRLCRSPLLSRITLAGCRNLSVRALEIALSAGHFTSIYLSKIAVVPPIVRAIGRNVLLQELGLASCDCDDKCLGFLRSCTLVRILILDSNVGISDVSLDVLCKLPCLITLDVSYTMIRSMGRLLSANPLLVNLGVRGAFLDRRAEQALENLTKLEVLDVSRCLFASGSMRSVIKLESLVHLRCAELAACDSDSLASLLQMPNLVSLDIYKCPNVSARSVSDLLKDRRLRYLRLGGVDGRLDFDDYAKVNANKRNCQVIVDL